MVSSHAMAEREPRSSRAADILAAVMVTPTFAELGRSAPVLDVASIRGRFPALERKQDGRPVAYFDGPGGTQVPVGVVKAMADYLFKHNANTHWRYPSSVETDAALGEARKTFAEFVNGDPSEIAFGQNMTTLTFHLSRALGRAWGPGDEIVVTELDHHANVDTWKALARDRGVTIRTVRMRPETGQLDEADLENAIRPGREARRDRRGVERPRDDQRRRAHLRPRPRRRGPLLRRRRPLRAARPDGRGADRLRFPGLLALQVLRPAPRRALGPPRPHRSPRGPEAHARARLVARAPGDGHALARGHRRSRRGRGFPRRRSRRPRVARAGRASRRPSPSSTGAARSSSRSSGSASRGSTASRSTGRRPRRPARRPCRSSSPGGPPTRWRRPWRSAGCTSRAGTSTP